MLLGATSLILGILVYIVILSTDYIVRFIPFEVEQKMFDFKLEEFLPVENAGSHAQIENYLQELVKNLQSANDDEEFKFKVRVVNSATPNAYAYPGGHIGVTTGLLKLLKSENGLAMVLGHEMGHHYERDPLKGISRSVIFALLFYTLGITDNDSWVQGVIGDMTMIGVMKFSRDQESSADAIGKLIIQRYYGHSGGASEFFEKMQEKEGDHELSWLSTHPATEERISALNIGERTEEKLIPLPEFILSTIE